MRRTFIFLVLIALMATLFGCGRTNLFNGQTSLSAGEKKLEEARVRQDLAKTKADNTAAKRVAEEIIADANSSTADKQEAYQIQGQAILGEQGVSATELVSNILTSVEAATGGNVDSFKSIQAALPVVDVNEMKKAANALNSSNPTTEQEKTDAGMANGLVATEIITSTFDENGDGAITDSDFASKSSDQIWDEWVTINKDASGTFSTSEGSATYYIDNSVNNLSNTSLDAQMIQTLQELQSGIQAINSLGTTAEAISSDQFQSFLINR
jgi:hypothetical protein